MKDVPETKTSVGVPSEEISDATCATKLALAGSGKQPAVKELIVSELDFHPPCRTAAQPAYLESAKTLQNYLEAHGISTCLFGIGSAKTLNSLLDELREGSSSLVASAGQGEEEIHAGDAAAGTASGGVTAGTVSRGSAEWLHQRGVVSSSAPSLVRIVEPLFIRLRYSGLVLVQESQELPDGRHRKRNMFLAQKTTPCDGRGLFNRIVSTINKELGVPAAKLVEDGVLRYRPDTYHFEVERIDSPSYPGLPSTYRTHFVQVDILESGAPLFHACGLPQGQTFITKEKAKSGWKSNSWRWYGIEDALKERIVKTPSEFVSGSCRPPKADRLATPDNTVGSSSGTAAEKNEWERIAAEDIHDAAALRNILSEAGIDTNLYGNGKAKTIDALAKELKQMECVLERKMDSGELRRVAEPVFVRLQWRNLVCVEDKQVFKDGRERKRNMLIAEKKDPTDVDAFATTSRALTEELGLPKTSLGRQGDSATSAPGHIAIFRADAYCCVEELMESKSYPGLQSLYITHYCCAELLDSSLPILAKMGGDPKEGSVFQTSEADKVNFWKWVDVREAQRNGTKGFPALGTDSQVDRSLSSGRRSTYFEPVQGEACSFHDGKLRALLEMGGVPMGSWGHFASDALRALDQELRSGASWLERDTRSGRVRRVLASAAVRLDGNSNQTDHGGGAGTPADGTPQVRGELACFEVVLPDDVSFPGLPCVHQTRRLALSRSGQPVTVVAGELSRGTSTMGSEVSPVDISRLTG